MDNHHLKQGLCRKVIDSNAQKVYRMPENLDNIQFAVKATGQIEVNSFTSNYQFTKTIQRNSGSSTSAFAGLNLGYLKIGAKTSVTQSSSFQSIFQEMKTKKAVLFQVRTEVTLAQFLYKDSHFLLSKYFQDSVAKLPTSKNDKVYFDFLRQYGTDYVHSGTLGGNYEYFYVFKEDTMKTTRQTTKTLRTCLKVSAGVRLFGFSAGGSHTTCTDKTGKSVDARSVANSATKKIVDISGGTAVVAGMLADSAMRQGGKANETKFERWVIGVQKNPIILRKRVCSICELIKSTKIQADAKDKKYELCLNATRDFYEPYGTDKCLPCKNGGSKLNIGGRCTCACQSSFFGDLCENQWGGQSTERSNYCL